MEIAILACDLTAGSRSAVRAEMMRTKPDVLPLTREGSRNPLREAKSVLRDLHGPQAISAGRQGRYAQQRGNKQKVRSGLHFIKFHYKHSGAAAAFACVCSPRIRIELIEEGGMIALRLVRLIERHSDQLEAELVTKLETSPRTTDLRKVPVEELRRRIQEILRHLSDWLSKQTKPALSSPHRVGPSWIRTLPWSLRFMSC